MRILVLIVVVWIIHFNRVVIAQKNKIYIKFKVDEHSCSSLSKLKLLFTNGKDTIEVKISEDGSLQVPHRLPDSTDSYMMILSVNEGKGKMYFPGISPNWLIIETQRDYLWTFGVDNPPFERTPNKFGRPIKASYHWKHVALIPNGLEIVTRYPFIDPETKEAIESNINSCP